MFCFMNFLAHTFSIILLSGIMSCMITFPITNLWIIRYFYFMQSNVSKERLTLTTVFHRPLPPGKHWALASASPLKPSQPEEDMRPQSPPGSHFVKDTCTELQERTLETEQEKNKKKQTKIDAGMTP